MTTKDLKAKRKKFLGDLRKLSELERSATPAPWAYSRGTGAQVSVGLVHDDKPGSTRLKKGGFFLFEIESDAYAGHADALGEEECEARAHKDAKLIAIARNFVRPMLDEIEKLRGERDTAERLFAEEARPVAARRKDDWHEDFGEALWWFFPVVEAPYVGSPLDDDFPTYVTHWTPLPEPPAQPDTE